MTRSLLAVVAAALVACTAASPEASPTPLPSATGAGTPLRVLVTWNDITRKGGPIELAHVCASRATGQPLCADTARDGTVTIRGPEGTYFVRVTGPAEGRWTEATRVVDLTGGPAAVWVELERLHRISGTVRDSSGAKVAEALACAHP
ncbi:MAG TPA: hypothetical protein VJQ09_07970, partial [Candidatus Limnocylindria bacterium]|nr:hypothetical protein [Candidatus Limnocylindria bacterium]